MQTALSSAQRRIYAAVLVVFVAALALPSILATQVFAAPLTGQSITMSNSLAAATGVTYDLKFNVATAGQIKSVIVDFDNTSPIIGATPATVAGLGVTGLTVTEGADHDGDFTPTTWTATNSGDIVVLTAADPIDTAAGDTVDLEIAGITNPSAAQTFYARVLTYSDDTEAALYDGDTTFGEYKDTTGVALATTQSNVEISALVTGTLIFKVGNSNGLNTEVDDITGTPSLTLGTGAEGSEALTTSSVSEGSVYFGFESNSANGTFVRIKGDSKDLTSGGNTIPGVDSASPIALVSGSTGAFGFRAAGTLGSPTIAAAYDSATTDYGNSREEVEDTYGDIVASTAGPTTGVIGQLTFGAIAGSVTPSGLYTASYSLIATPSY